MKRDLKGWGPFDSEFMSAEERQARIRCVRALAVVYLGRQGSGINRMLRTAETDPSALEACRIALAAMPEGQLRQIWNAYLAVSMET